MAIGTGTRLASRVVHAVVLHAFGPPSNLRFEELPDPEPGRGQLRIAVAACGVHLIDARIRAGRPMGPMPLPELPQVPGREVAGVVDAVRDVEAVHATELAPDVAVAMIGTGRTAMAILDVAHLRPDDVVLVTAAAG